MSHYDDALSNTWAKFEAQFMEKLNKTEAKLKKSVACSKEHVKGKTFVSKTFEKKDSLICFEAISVEHRQLVHVYVLSLK